MRWNSKPIKDFEPDYLITPDGRVYSLKSKKYLRPGITGRGYYQVHLYKSGNRYPKRIARLVAQAFIPNPENKPEINHKDGIKVNNDVSNLEWVTSSENQLHAYATGLKEKPPTAGSPKIPVNVYNYATGKFLSAQTSLLSAAREYGLPVGRVHNVLTGKRNHVGGLTFKRIA